MSLDYTQDIVTPPVIPDPPEQPSRADPSTFEDRADEAIDWTYNVFPEAAKDVARATHQNALAAEERAYNADKRADDADESAIAAEESAQAADTSAGLAAGSASSAWDAAAAAGEAAGLPQPVPAGAALRTNSSGAVRWQGSYVAISSAITLAEGDAIAVDTSGGAFTVTLPAAPAPGVRVSVLDAVGSFADEPLTVARNGENIMSLAEDVVLDLANVSLDLLYINSTRGWVIV